jgi:integrase
MGVDKYQVHGITYYRIDEWLTRSDGPPVRFRKKKIPTREQAFALVAKKKAEAFEGRFFDKVKSCTTTVAEVWTTYQPISQRDNDTWLTDKGRAAHLLEHLGTRRAAHLTQEDVDRYRRVRLEETTPRGTKPAPATLDREVELLKRMLNYSVTCRKLPSNPIARVPLLRRPNVRRRMITEKQFQTLLGRLEVEPKDTPYAARVKTVFRAVVITAFDTGERKMEILNLRRSQLHLKEGFIDLAPEDTKTEEGRPVYLTRRTIAALEALPADLRSEHVFINPETGRPYRDIRKLWVKYRAEAGISADTWFHDYRRSYATNARRLGIDERTIMRQTGHKTRSAFDRYNIVDDSDQRAAVAKYEAGHVLDIAAKEGGLRNDEGPQFPEGLRELP